MKYKQDEYGFHLIAVVLAVVVLAAISLVGWKVYDSQQKPDQSSTQQTSQQPHQTTADVIWMYDEGIRSWRATSTPPACPEPLKLQVSPVDINKVTSMLYPGQYRGGQYKAHGGFRFDDSNSTDIEVRVPMDSRIIVGARYIEFGDLQYMFDLLAPCGILYRFDHLVTLAPEFQKLADQLPEAKVDDSRTTNFSSRPLVKAGDLITSSVGHAKPNKNVFIDFGVYDLRNQNEASKKDPKLGERPGTSVGYAHFAVCWFDMLPGDAPAKVKSLPVTGKEGKTSDLCI